MKQYSNETSKHEKALLIGVETPADESEEVATLLDELQALTETLDIEILGKEQVRVRKLNPALLIGTGKAAEIKALVESLHCTLVVFDKELSPSQQRNWEEMLGIPVIERQEIILDIFAKRAKTKEAILQVELARLEYAFPRLAGAWTHLSRQRGGSAMQRGVGETQIEMDRRMIRMRISRLKKELHEVIQHRDVQRKKRIKIPLPTAAIIGYTNAGKSSLLNALTGSNILAEDKLFATLDPTTRRLELPSGQVLLVTDTVGFVRRLPHGLIEAFKATLEEAVVAQFLIHVVDLSSPDIDHHMQTTLKVMKELGADKKVVITVFNKIDLQPNPLVIGTLHAKYPEALFISTKDKMGLTQLLEKITEQLKAFFTPMRLLLPHDRYDLLSELHEMGAIKEECHEEEGIYITANIPTRFITLVNPYRI